MGNYNWLQTEDSRLIVGTVNVRTSGSFTDLLLTDPKMLENFEIDSSKPIPRMTLQMIIHACRKQGFKGIKIQCEDGIGFCILEIGEDSPKAPVFREAARLVEDYAKNRQDGQSFEEYQKSKLKKRKTIWSLFS